MNVLPKSAEFSTLLVPPLGNELETAAQRIAPVSIDLKEAALTAFQKDLDRAEKHFSTRTRELTYTDISKVCMASREAKKASIPTKLWRAIGLGGKPVGLYAKQDIPQWTKIGVYGGLAVDPGHPKLIDRSTDDVIWLNDTISKEWGLPKIGVLGYGPLRTANDSKFTPNTVMKSFRMHALRDIEAGEELTYDYGGDNVYPNEAHLIDTEAAKGRTFGIAEP